MKDSTNLAPYSVGNMWVWSPSSSQLELEGKSLKSAEKKIEQLEQYINEEISKVHIEKDGQDATISKSGIFDFGMGGISPYASTYVGESFRKSKVTQNTLNDLRTYAYELPQAPESVAYLINSSFAHGWSLTPRKGKKENKPLRARIEKFFGSCNDNNSPFLEIYKTAWRSSVELGDGYLEKTFSKGDNGRKYLVELNHIDPSNIIIQVDEKLAKQGIVKILYYIKVENVNASAVLSQALDQVPEDMKLKPDELIHIRFIDDGETYGKSPFEYNQQISRFILNVINMNSKKFSNEVRHSIWIKLGANATQYDAERTIASYRANYLGKGNFGKPLVTFGGIEVVVLDNGKAQEFDYGRFMHDVGSSHAPSLLGINPSEVDNTDAKYSNASQGHITTMLNTIFPLQSRMETIINEQILPALEGLDPDNPKEQSTYIFTLERENLNTMWDGADLSLAPQRGYITVNEWRKLVDPKNLPPIKEDWADKHFILLSTGQSLAWMDDPSTYFGGDDELTEDPNADTNDNPKDNPKEDPGADTAETDDPKDDKPKPKDDKPKPTPKKPQKRYLLN